MDQSAQKSDLNRNRSNYIAYLPDAAGIFLLALVVRAIFLFELRANSYLANITVSDAQTYRELARGMIHGMEGTVRAFWQAPLYPFLLSLFFRVFGENLLPAQLAHVALGSVNCALIALCARRLFDRKSGLLAGVIAALYAPFWLFDVQLLPASLNITMYLGIFLLLETYLRSLDWKWLAGASLLVGLAIISHGLAIFLLPVVMYVALKHPPENFSQRLTVAAGCAALILMIPLLVSLRNSWIEGKFVFVSYNAGINFYVGNNSDFEDVFNRRNGLEWSGLFKSWADEAAREASSEAASMNGYFFAKGAGHLVRDPLHAVALLAKKTLLTFGGVEISRNFPIYPLREHSKLFALLNWRVEAAGATWLAFPSGIVLPLAILGFLLCLFRGDRSEPTRRLLILLPGLLALAHLIGMILFFPATRYRLPAVALLLPYSAHAMMVLLVGIQSSARRVSELPSPLPLHKILTAALALFVVCNFGSGLSWPVDANKKQAEHVMNQALWHMQTERYASGTDLLREAHRLDPTYPEPLYYLGVHIFTAQKNATEALPYCERLRKLAPDIPRVEQLWEKVRQVSLQEQSSTQTAQPL